MTTGVQNNNEFFKQKGGIFKGAQPAKPLI